MGAVGAEIQPLEDPDELGEAINLVGDMYEYLTQHFAAQSGKSKGQFYTPADLSRIMAQVIGIGPDTRRDQTVYDHHVLFRVVPHQGRRRGAERAEDRIGDSIVGFPRGVARRDSGPELPSLGTHGPH